MDFFKKKEIILKRNRITIWSYYHKEALNVRNLFELDDPGLLFCKIFSCVIKKNLRGS